VSSGRTRLLSTAAIARTARVGSVAFEITLQDCAMESMRHSLFEAEPRGSHHRSRLDDTNRHPRLRWAMYGAFID
jgi:hypothetical protein